jgi:hypothetical protein
MNLSELKDSNAGCIREFVAQAMNVEEKPSYLKLHLYLRVHPIPARADILSAEIQDLLLW